MCRSVPQIPVSWTRIRTSLIPIVGSGTSSSHNPGFSYRLRRAFIMFAPVLYDDTFPHAEERANSHTRAAGGSGRAGGQPGPDGGAPEAIRQGLAAAREGAQVRGD